MPFFREIQNFIKSECSDGFFPNSIPNVIEHWSLHKELHGENFMAIFTTLSMVISFSMGLMIQQNQ